jgi:asparagine synthase (glutamine-hydrolysing)
MITRVRRERLTYVSFDALVELYDSVQEVERAAREGVLIEAGCALGGSALIMAAAKKRTRPFFVYDGFDLIPPPTEVDGPDAERRYHAIISGRSMGIRRDRYYGYENNLVDRVRATFDDYGQSIVERNIHLVKGMYAETLNVTQPVALAHLDCDWYDSVLTCFRRIEPRLVPNGRIIVDDYDYWPGCRKAVEDYFTDKKDRYLLEFHQRLHIVRR